MLSSTLKQVPERLGPMAAALAVWAANHARWVLAASWTFAVLAGLLSSRLSVQGDFSRLLPPDAVAVRHLRELEARTRVLADYMIGIEASDPKARSAAARALRVRLEHIDDDLVSGISADERPQRQFIWSHRYLYAALSDLVAARDALQRALERANPFSLQLDDNDGEASTEPSSPPPPHDALSKLELQLREAEERAKDPGEFVSGDGRLQRITVRTTFTADDTAKGNELNRLLETASRATEREFPGVRIGMTGDVIRTDAEHDALLRGMLVSTLVTVALVLFALVLFYRSVLIVAALSWSLLVGVLGTFAFTWVTIGHLNLASAFLSSIVIGNGINFGLVFLARYSEERRAGVDVPGAVSLAAAGSAPGTLTAAFTASVAYGSLAITPFRGFRDFGIIGAVGMLVCWFTAFSVLPAALAWLGPKIRSGKRWHLANLLSYLLPSRPRIAAAVSVGLIAATGLATLRYLVRDPFEDDLRNLQSDAVQASEAARWMGKFDEAFGNGLTGGFAIAVRDRREVAAVAAKLRSVDAGKPDLQHLFSRIISIDDVLPTEQPEKLRILGEIREMLDTPALRRLAPEDQARLRALRPPDTLRAVTEADLPPDLALPFTERDGSRGRMILANTGFGVDTWRASSLEHFAKSVRGLGLSSDVVIGGTAFVFSDMLSMMKRDGPRATLAALVGSTVVVFIFLGLGRHARAALQCAALGTLGMLTVASLLSIKVNFLDFVALPITIGIGVDYAVNIAARAKQSNVPDAGRRAILATGPAVMLCSYTTIVGYASLLFSLNRGIRSFGLSAMIGEITCLAAAMLLAPALLDGKGNDARAGRSESAQKRGG